MSDTGLARNIVLGSIGILAFLALWEVAGSNGWGGLTLPPLSKVLLEYTSAQRQGLFLRAMQASLSALAQGLALGVILGVGAAALTRLLPPFQEGLDGFAALVNAIPAIALAPIFMLLLSPETVPVAIAALNVFFVAYVAARTGLTSASAAHNDVMSALGASHWRRFRLLDLPSALPAIASALRLAVPVALVGIVVGEWFGAPRGFGLIMISAMQNFQIPLLWATVLLTSLCSMVLYLAFTGLERLILVRYR